MIKVGISAASLEGAKKNLQAEIPGWDFNEIKKQADETWEKELSLIKEKPIPNPFPKGRAFK